MSRLYASSMKKIGLFTAACGVSLGLAGTAQAANVGFTLVLSGSTNVPTFNLTNDSDSALLTGFTFTIGNTAMNFDNVEATVAPAGGDFILVSPDSNSAGGLRTDMLELQFTHFDPTEFAQWASDVDPDSFNRTENYETVFFNNGDNPNSVATATFSDGSILALTLDDRSGAESSHTFEASDASVVPVPAAAWLFGSALLGLVGVSRTRKA